MKHLLIFLTLACCSTVYGQSKSKKVLFIGNSYTGVNNLPQMVGDIAVSVGDTLLFESNVPGGYTLKRHSTNVATLDKIRAGNWDYVVLQEQSQYPSFPIEQVENDVFPYARFLDSIVKLKNPCSETVFYMTWGRKNGDPSNCASWPPVCTYAGMDSLLKLRYTMMADSNRAVLSPVGVVWNYIRKKFPQISLYQPDESHPSIAGTYAAACVFYAVLFRKDPAQITYNGVLTASEAENIRNAAKWMVYDSLAKWRVGALDPNAEFNSMVASGNQVVFKNTSSNCTAFRWDFGDGSGDTARNPKHTYQNSGTYAVRLITGRCGRFDTITKNILIEIPFGIDGNGGVGKLRVYPNPTESVLTVEKQGRNSAEYVIFNALGETVLRGMLNGETGDIQLVSLEEGIYFLQIIENNKVSGMHKFIISKP
jgi:hypothetical protein